MFCNYTFEFNHLNCTKLYIKTLKTHCKLHYLALEITTVLEQSSVIHNFDKRIIQEFGECLGLWGFELEQKKKKNQKTLRYDLTIKIFRYPHFVNKIVST